MGRTLSSREPAQNLVFVRHRTEAVLIWRTDSGLSIVRHQDAEDHPSARRPVPLPALLLQFRQRMPHAQDLRTLSCASVTAPPVFTPPVVHVRGPVSVRPEWSIRLIASSGAAHRGKGEWHYAAILHDRERQNLVALSTSVQNSARRNSGHDQAY